MCDIQIFLKFGLFIGDLAGFWDRFGRLRYLASGNPGGRRSADGCDSCISVCGGVAIEGPGPVTGGGGQGPSGVT